jgi:glyoxylate/hydroxypyruvate reductase
MLFPGSRKIDKELLSTAGDKLKMLATFSVGYDHIDLKECRKRGISIGYTPGRIK